MEPFFSLILSAFIPTRSSTHHSTIILRRQGLSPRTKKGACHFLSNWLFHAPEHYYLVDGVKALTILDGGCDSQKNVHLYS